MTTTITKQSRKTRNSSIPSEATFGPRIRFNWGFHDAQRDAVHSEPRTLTESTHDPKHVGRSYDRHYFHGYAHGLEAYGRDGVRSEASTAAWTTYRETQGSRLRREMEADAISGMAHCLRRPMDDLHVIARGIEEAELSWNI